MTAPSSVLQDRAPRAAAVSVVIGYGRAGRDLHHRSLRELAARGVVGGEVIIVDRVRPAGLTVGDRWMPDLAACVAALPDLGAAVFHVAVPVAEHHSVVVALLDAGARQIVLEKPMAETAVAARTLVDLARRAGARLVPMAVWPSSAVTREVRRAIDDGRVGRPVILRMEQSKPRYQRTLDDAAHRSPFEIEMPHQVLLALDLCGPVERVDDVRCWPMAFGEIELTNAGGAMVRLVHRGGAVSALVSDLTSPVRIRRLYIEGESNAVTAHFPISSDDHVGHVLVAGDPAPLRMRDAPLTQFLAEAYRYFDGRRPDPPTGVELHLEAMEVLETAAAMADSGPAYQQNGGFPW